MLTVNADVCVTGMFAISRTSTIMSPAGIGGHAPTSALMGLFTKAR